MASFAFRDLLVKNKKDIVLNVLNAVLDEPDRMEELMECFFDENLRLCQFASWPVGMIADHNPDLILPYLEKMLVNLDTPHHNAVIRNTFRTLQNLDIPEELEGLTFEKAFDFLANPQNAIGIRVFAMSVCGNIAKKYPELKHELIPVIEEQMPFGSAGFISRGRKVLKSLK
jgi:hypothetical protein